MAAHLAQVPPDEPKPLAVEAAMEAPLVDPVTGEDLGTTRVTIGISTTGPKIEASRDVLDRSILDLLPWRKRHWRFMKRLLNDSAEVGLLENELTRVLGVEPETAIEAVRLINSLLRPQRRDGPA